MTGEGLARRLPTLLLHRLADLFESGMLKVECGEEIPSGIGFPETITGEQEGGREDGHAAKESFHGQFFEPRKARNYTK